MTTILTLNEFSEQFHEADEEELKFDPSDELDVTYKYNARYSEGWERLILLREDIHLSINQYQHKDRVIISRPEEESCYVGFQFLLSGTERVDYAPTASKTSWVDTNSENKYRLNSTGSRNLIVVDYGINLWSEIRLDVHERILRSFVTSPEQELPEHLQHLVGPASQEIYRRTGDIQPTMNAVLQQILHCPYQGMVKRAYLESKTIELVALVLAHESVIQQGENKRTVLKSEQIEKVYYAKEILLRDLSHPPSLEALAQQADLSDFMLRQGFRQTFGTTVFGQLQAHRLEMAKQLLAERDISVTEVAHRVGYASVPSFVKAFKRKFEITPKAYQKTCR